MTNHPTKVIHQFDLPLAKWWQSHDIHSHWKDIVHKDIQQINLVLEDAPMLYEGRESWKDKEAFMGSMHSCHEI